MLRSLVIGSILLSVVGCLCYGLALVRRRSTRSPKALANSLAKKARLFWYTILAPNGAEEHTQRIDNVRLVVHPSIVSVPVINVFGPSHRVSRG